MAVPASIAALTSAARLDDDATTASFGPSATGLRTEKPRPQDGPPSAWMSTATLAWLLLMMNARRFTHGPVPLLLVRVITTRAPARISSARRYPATWKLNCASG